MCVHVYMCARLDEEEERRVHICCVQGSHVPMGASPNFQSYILETSESQWMRQSLGCMYRLYYEVETDTE